MRTNRKLMLTLIMVVTCGLAIGFGHPALADALDISVGGEWICRITHDASGYTADQRAVEVNKRITEVLSAPEFRRGANVSVHPMGESAVIMVGDTLVFTVTPEDAMDTTVKPLELAHQWAERLATGLSRAFPDPDNHVF